MEIRVQHGLGDVRERVRKIEADQIPFAASLALNAVSRKAREGMPSVFERQLDRPRSFTTKQSIFTIASSKADLRTTVGIKDIQAAYLAPILVGSTRQQKVSERLFMGRYFVPSKAMPLDAYGNVTKANLLAILRAAESGGLWRGQRVVVLKTARGNLPAGVYADNSAKRGRRTGVSGLTPLFFFVNRAPSYRQQIRFEDEIQKVVASEFGAAFESALLRAMGSAR